MEKIKERLLLLLCFTAVDINFERSSHCLRVSEPGPGDGQLFQLLVKEIADCGPN